MNETVLDTSHNFQENHKLNNSMKDIRLAPVLNDVTNKDTLKQAEPEITTLEVPGYILFKINLC